MATVLLLTAIYVSLHLTAYVLLRSLPKMQKESAIFSFHILSFCGSFLVVAFVTYMLPGASFIDLLIFSSIHGIYSLSFLEAWSLAQGSYSLNILREIEKVSGKGERIDLGKLAAVGDHKLAKRSIAFVSLGLVEIDQGTMRLKRLGKIAAMGLHAINRIANVKING